MEKDMNTDAIPVSDIEAIQAELTRHKPAMTTMNLVVWIDSDIQRDWVIERATRVSAKHPSRTIILESSPGRSGAFVRQSANGADADDGQNSRVEIGVAELSPIAACELATSLLAPDVPTVLWWSADSLNEDTAFRCFFDNADSAVVDSSLGVRDASTLDELSTFYEQHRSVALRDLAWMRLHPWQDIIAQFFDDPSLREELFSIYKLNIVSGSDAEALYLSGWLASRLGWNAVGHDAFTDRYGHRIRFEHERDGQPRRVHSIAITTTTSTYFGTVDKDDNTVVRVWVEGKNAREERIFPLQAVDNASLIEQAALEGGGTDEIFETALRMVATLIDG
jgi:glucose-6-phosphate dehydrogenase assembly protein OpcA